MELFVQGMEATGIMAALRGGTGRFDRAWSGRLLLRISAGIQRELSLWCFIGDDGRNADFFTAAICADDDLACGSLPAAADIRTGRGTRLARISAAKTDPALRAAERRADQ